MVCWWRRQQHAQHVTRARRIHTWRVHAGGGCGGRRRRGGRRLRQQAGQLRRPCKAQHAPKRARSRAAHLAVECGRGGKRRQRPRKVCMQCGRIGCRHARPARHHQRRGVHCSVGPHKRLQHARQCAWHVQTWRVCADCACRRRCRRRHRRRRRGGCAMCGRAMCGRCMDATEKRCVQCGQRARVWLAGVLAPAAARPVPARPAAPGPSTKQVAKSTHRAQQLPAAAATVGAAAARVRRHRVFF
eukprot:219274-Chlamydomonas_euryale.AAC.1